jgi:ABC-type dipeptide/oligopeptide/nickel transport system permease subunit
MLKFLPDHLLSRQSRLDWVYPGKFFRLSTSLGLPVALVLGGLMVLFMLLFIWVLPVFIEIDGNTIRGAVRLSPPGDLYWFGTDALGRDLFSRVVEGARLSVWISFLSTVCTAVVGIMLGLWSGYYEGWLDHLLSRMIEIILALPTLLLAIVLIARFGSSLPVLITALMISGAPTFYRITRNETITIKRQPFVDAGRSIGLRNSTIIVRYILLNIYPTLLTLFSIRMGNTLLIISGLGFIGLAVQPPQAELGALLASGRDYFHTAWWLYLIPSGFILFIVLGFNLLGEGLRDWMDRFSYTART